MSGGPTHIGNLSDTELYEELKKYGFPAGPVVASTRKLYERKLSQILEGGRRHGEQELLQEGDEMEEHLTQPAKIVGGYSQSQWRPDSKSSSVRSRTNLPQTYSTYSDDMAAGRSSYYTLSREQEKDKMGAHSSVSSSYLGTVRGIGTYDDTIKTSPSWLSDSSVTQPYISPSWRTYGSSGDEDFTKSRYRTSLSDPSPPARQQMASRYSLTGFSDDTSSVWNRRNTERQRNKFFSSKAQFGVLVFLVILAIAFCYVVYNAWHENDPYYHIEQEVEKITEEMKLEDKQE